MSLVRSLPLSSSSPRKEHDIMAVKKTASLSSSRETGLYSSSPSPFACHHFRLTSILVVLTVLYSSVQSVHGKDEVAVCFSSLDSLMFPLIREGLFVIPLSRYMFDRQSVRLSVSVAVRFFIRDPLTHSRFFREDSSFSGGGFFCRIERQEESSMKKACRGIFLPSLLLTLLIPLHVVFAFEVSFLPSRSLCSLGLKMS